LKAQEACEVGFGRDDVRAVVTQAESHMRDGMPSLVDCGVVKLVVRLGHLLCSCGA
jgi:hypothetical protein